MTPAGSDVNRNAMGRNSCDPGWGRIICLPISFYTHSIPPGLDNEKCDNLPISFYIQSIVYNLNLTAMPPTPSPRASTFTFSNFQISKSSNLQISKSPNLLLFKFSVILHCYYCSNHETHFYFHGPYFPSGHSDCWLP